MISAALGQGWRIGFSGLLHMEVFTQRLLQEHKAEAVISAPSVPYKIRLLLNYEINIYAYWIFSSISVLIK